MRPWKARSPPRRQAHRVAGAVQDRVAATGVERVGDEFLRRQVRPFQIALGDARPPDPQFALLAGPAQAAPLPHDVGRVVRDRTPDRHRLARARLAGGRHHGRFGRAIGVEETARARRPSVDQRRRQRLAAEQDQPEPRHLPGQHGEERRHRVEDRDAALREEVGQPLDVADHRRRRHEQRGSDHQRDPNLLHRQVEGDGRALEHDVVGPEAVEVVRRAQEVADVALGDDDALRHARRARRVDHVGGVLARQAPAAGIKRLPIGRVDELRRGQDRAAGRRPGRQGLAREKALRVAILEADRDAIGRGVRVERQPGGTGLGDRDLGDEEIGPALHPQPDDVARTDAASGEPPRDGFGGVVDIAVGQASLAERDRGVSPARLHARREDVRQRLVAKEVWP